MATYLEISVNDGLSVEVVNGTDDFSSVEPGSILTKDSFSFQVEVQFAPVDILRD